MSDLTWIERDLLELLEHAHRELDAQGVPHVPKYRALECSTLGEIDPIPGAVEA